MLEVIKYLKKKILEHKDRKRTPLVELAHKNHIQTSYLDNKRNYIEIPDETLIQILEILGVKI